MFYARKTNTEEFGHNTYRDVYGGKWVICSSTGVGGEEFLFAVKSKPSAERIAKELNEVIERNKKRIDE